jgi:hypothetical protein
MSLGTCLACMTSIVAGLACGAWIGVALTAVAACSSAEACRPGRLGWSLGLVLR